MRSIGTPELLVILIPVLIGVALLHVLPWFFIYKKLGHHPAMGCLMFFPLVSLVMLFVLAFTEWPIERKLRNQSTPPAPGA